MSSSDVSTQSSVTTIMSTTAGDTINGSTTTEPPHIRLLTQLFLQTITCQVITGFFAWAALCITIQHVGFVFPVLLLSHIILLNYDCYLFQISRYIFIYKTIM